MDCDPRRAATGTAVTREEPHEDWREEGRHPEGTSDQCRTVHPWNSTVEEKVDQPRAVPVPDPDNGDCSTSVIHHLPSTTIRMSIVKRIVTPSRDRLALKV